MNRLIALALLVLIGNVCVTPAEAHGGVSVGIGFGGYYPYHYYNPYYAPYYGYPYYYAPPPPIVYTEPAPSPYIVEQTPPEAPPEPQYYNDEVPSSPSAASSAANAEPTFVDKKGRTCRKFQTTIDNSHLKGTMCLQADGSWRTVDE